MFVRLVIMLKVPKQLRLLMRGKQLIKTTHLMISLRICPQLQWRQNLCLVEILSLKRKRNQDQKMFLDILYRPRKSLKSLKMLHGVPGRVKPFGVEVRNVKCLRCGNYGHQSGDCECPLKDAIMPNEESRLKRDDPLTAIMAQMDPTELLKWELKQKPGMSPPRGGFQPEDPNQQIVAEDIFDEYGGFLSGGNIPDLLTNISHKPKKRKSSKKSKHKRQSSPSSRELEVSDEDASTSDDGDRKSKEKRTKKKKEKERQNYYGSNSSEGSEFHRHQRKRSHKHSYSSEGSDSDRQYRTKESREKHSYTLEDSGSDLECWGKKGRSKHSYSSAEDFDRHHRKRKHNCSYSSEASDSGRLDQKTNSTQKPYTVSDMDADRYRSKKSRQKYCYSSDDADHVRHDRKSKDKHSYSSEDSDHGRHEHKKKKMQKRYISENSDTVRQNSRSEKSRFNHPYSSEDDAERHLKGEKSRHKHSSSRRFEDSNSYAERRSRHHRHH